MKKLLPTVLLLAGVLAAGPAARAVDDAIPSPSDEPVESAWPHQIDAGDETILVHQPEVESWVGTRLSGRAAVSVQTKASPQESYGVIWFTARTEIDKATRLVTLDGVQVTKGTFPAAADTGDATLAAIRGDLGEALHTIALDRLQASLLVEQAEAKESAPRFQNDPPRILVSSVPALLILVDGKPVQRAVPGSFLFRIVNTRALMALDPQSGRYDLWLSDRWVEAPSLDGPWTVVSAPSKALDAMKASLTDSDEVDLLDDTSPDVKALLGKGDIPKIYVSTGPAELLQTQGKPQLAPIEGTQLLEVTNTSSDILIDPGSNQTYVLLSGRWFRAPSLDGPWSYVAPDKLPADFAKIPENHPKGRVLTSVAGTPEANEAVIANQIPQTATVQRGQVTFEPQYDGPPRFAPIDGTPLSAAANTPSAVIEVGPASYYGCENGVWFQASTPTGPWVVASTVPPVIYTIPPSSRLYDVTFVRVYDSTPDVVYVGYTPGYYGTYVAPGGVVVYGTGYQYDPWIGNVWIGSPYTYGFGAGYVWGASTGFMLGYTSGALFDPWWGPWGWGWGWGWGPIFVGGFRHHHDHHGHHDHYDHHHFWDHRNFHAFNRDFDAYRRWDRGVARHPDRIHVGSSGHGTGAGLLSGRDGGVYRPGAHGWERHDAGGWRSLGHDHAGTQQSLDRGAWARGAGDARSRDFQSHDFGRQPFGPRTMGGRNLGHGFGGGGFAGAPRSPGGGFHGGGGGGGFHGGGGGGGRR